MPFFERSGGLLVTVPVPKSLVEHRRGQTVGRHIFFISFFLFNNKENPVIMNNWTGGGSELSMSEASTSTRIALPTILWPTRTVPSIMIYENAPVWPQWSQQRRGRGHLSLHEGHLSTNEIVPRHQLAKSGWKITSFLCYFLTTLI